jgi:hypothetical protein
VVTRILAIVVVLAACGDGEAVKPSDDAGVPRRVFDPPPRKVRAVPPFDIHAGGVGPYYRLGAPLRDVLLSLPSGPRVELLQIDRVVDFSLVRTDGDAIVLGANRNARIDFITVLAPGIARTARGIEVGLTLVEAEQMLGPRLTAPLADPRMARFAAAPELQLVTDGLKIEGIVVAAPREPEEHGAPRARTPRCAERSERSADLIRAGRLGKPVGARVLPGCFTGEHPEAVVVADEELAVVGGDVGKPRRLAGQPIADAAFVGTLDVDRDGRHEIVVVHRRVSDKLVLRVEVLALEGGRLVTRGPAGGQQAYAISTTSAAWVGAKLPELDLVLELEAGNETIIVSGLYLRRVGSSLREIAPLERITLAVPRGRRRPGPGVAVEEPGAAPPSAAAPDAGR